MELPLQRLVGDPGENFYRLGLEDQKRHKLLLRQTKSLLPLSGSLETAAQKLVPRVLATSGVYRTWMAAYAAGLGEPEDSLAYAMLVPELSPAMGWLRLGTTPSLGCSSYFLWDEALDAPVHGRVLDFPLMDSFDKQERALLFEFPGMPKILSFGTVGFPWPSITAMTEHGVTFALHQKYDSVFNPGGTPIFQIVFRLLTECQNAEEVLDFLKRSQSIITWGMYLSFPDGKVLAVDLMGDKLHANCHQLEPGRGLYFCNFFEEPKRSSPKTPPWGTNSYNQMRMDKGRRKLERAEGKGELALLKEMTTPLKNSKKDFGRHFRSDPITMASIQALTMAPKAARALLIPGLAPKHYQGKFLEFSDAFSSCRQKLRRGRGGTKANYTKGVEHLMRAQMAHARKIPHDIYHHMQMGLPLLEGYPEQRIGEFFFLVFQYIHEKNLSARRSALERFRSMEGQLPPYLDDHRLMFITRLERKLGEPLEVQAEQIRNPMLRELFRTEPSRRIPLFIYPRMDVLDILYL